jgi:hypothetical protein
VTVKGAILKQLCGWPGVLVIAMASTACAYHSPTAPTPPAPDLTTPATLTLDVAPGTSRTAAITATVRNHAGLALPAVPVAFSVDVGTLTAGGVTAVIPAVERNAAVSWAAEAWLPTTTTGSCAALVALQPGPASTPGTRAVGEPTPTGAAATGTTVPDRPDPRDAGLAGSTVFGLSLSAGVRVIWDFGDASPAVTTTDASTSHVARRLYGIRDRDG